METARRYVGDPRRAPVPRQHPLAVSLAVTVACSTTMPAMVAWPWTAEFF